MGNQSGKQGGASKPLQGIKKAYESVRNKTTKVWPKVMQVKHKFDDIYNSNFNPFNLYEKGRDAIQNAVQEIPISTVRNAVNSAMKVVDTPIMTAKSALDGVVQAGSSVLEDADSVMKMTGLGYQENNMDIEHGKRLATRLMDNYGYSAEHAQGEARRMLESGEEMAHQHLSRFTNMGMQHFEGLKELYDSANHGLKSSALYEGGQHTFPPHGNTLVGTLRSTLDSAFGSRAVYEPYLESRVLDRTSEAAKTYIDTQDQRSRMQQLSDLVMTHNPWIQQSLY